MGFSVRVYDRNDNPVMAPTGLTLAPVRWEAAALGGPTSAEVSAAGSVDSLLSLATWLGYRIEIVSNGAAVWWGEIDTARVLSSGLKREVTLEDMANRVRVLYSTTQAGGDLAAAATDWGEDADSVTRYGKRELVHSARGALTATQAEALRRRLLEAGKLPQKRLQFADGQEISGSLICRGHWARLGDVYFQQLAGLEEHNPDGGTPIPLGLGFTSAYLGFVAEGKVIHEIDGKFANFGYENLLFTVAGTALNNGIHMVVSADKRTPVAYVSNGVHFAANDDLMDNNNGLSFIATGDVIWVSGAAAPQNTGSRLVKTSGISHIEVSPGWGSGFQDSGGVGPAVTIRRGNAVKVEPEASNEAPNGSAVETITAYGQRVYQSFALAVNTPWTLAAVELRVRRVGNPVDSLRVGLYNDSGGAPGSVLEQVTMTGSTLANEMGWTSLAFSNTALLAYGVTYGLLIDRTGAMDADNFYEIEVDQEGGYARGSMRLYDGAAYQASVSGDLIFRCLGATDTAWQVQGTVNGCGVDELAAVMVEAESGLDALQYRGEDETAASIVDDLLAQGTAAGARLLASVATGRLVRVFEQPQALQRLWVWREGTLVAATGGAALPGWLPAGVWVHVDDVLLSGAWAGLSPLFVERASYQVGQGWRLEAEHQPKLADLLGVAQG
jgi:hypothetical protein